MSDLAIVAVDPDRLQAMRERGADEHGNPWTRWTAEGWEPLRCCLRTAAPGGAAALINYTPWTAPSPWASAGPVFVHLAGCAGPESPDWPANAATGPVVLRPYDRSGAIAYESIVVTAAGADNAAAARSLLDDPAIDRVHVHSVGPGCFAFEVRRA